MEVTLEGVMAVAMGVAEEIRVSGAMVTPTAT